MAIIPSSAVAPLDELGVEITEQGARFTRPLSYEAWASLGLSWANIQRALRWCVGDWLNYGEARYGEMYAQAAELTGYAPEYLQNIKWVTSRIPLERRRPSITSFSTYQSIASLPEAEQEWWLDLVEANEWNRDSLRLALRESRAEEKEEMMVTGGDGETPVFRPQDVAESFEYLREQWWETWSFLDSLGVDEKDPQGNPLPLRERVRLALERKQ